MPVTVISNDENRGFPAAVNQGLQQARGEYLVLLNNDVVVTDAWLDQLTGLAEMRIDSPVDATPHPTLPHKGGGISMRERMSIGTTAIPISP